MRADRRRRGPGRRTAAPREGLAGWQRALSPLGGTRLGAWYFATIARRVDPLLMRATRGRLTSVGRAPVLTLVTIGARTGARRENPVLFLRRGEDFVLIASHYGRQRHPAWFHNLVRRPHAEVVVGRQTYRCAARVAEGPERDELWRRATELYAGYRGYERRARPRRIPVVVLTPRPDAEPFS
jgi:deazaflavin-dependent oxidoreductase (nitroreductase family)